jgi:tripartite-type tricarboxylate transporter receptor subunit TctC
MRIDRRALLALPALATLPARAQTPAAYPSRPVRIVVPFAAGGSSDLVARLIGRQLHQATGQPFVIENIPGGNGVVGTVTVNNAPADGHALLLATTTTFSANPFTMRNLPYDADRDFSLVAPFGTTAAYLMVPTDSPWRSAQELIADIKARPGVLNSGWFNGSSRIPGALLKRLAGLDFEEVAYKIFGNAINDLQSGQIQFVYIDMVAADSYLQSGRFRPLAVTGPTRLARYPDVPAMRELYEGFETGGYLGLGMRRSTPEPLRVAMNRYINAVVRQPEIAQQLRGMSLEPVLMDLTEADAYSKREREKYGRIIRLAGIEPE